MMKGMGDLLKQAQKMQEKLAKIQQGLAEKTVEATSGGGMVTVVANGKQEVVSIKIEPEVVESKDAQMLEDLVLAAVNGALKKAQDMASEEISKITGGMSIPGLFPP